jgi:hypothetical protein
MILAADNRQVLNPVVSEALKTLKPGSLMAEAVQEVTSKTLILDSPNPK